RRAAGGKASMGPSICIDGEARARPASWQRAARFNGAVDMHRRRDADLVPPRAGGHAGFNGAVDMHRRRAGTTLTFDFDWIPLQWGRRYAATERDAAGGGARQHGPLQRGPREPSHGGDG